MTKTKSTKRALLMSALALLSCVALLVGSTYAWFTDSVTSTGNKIVAGKLEVDLLMGTDVDTYVSIADQEAAIFGADSLVAQNDPTDTLWEPGKTQIVYLAVANKGNLDLKYNIALNVVDGGLIGSLEYAIVDGAKYGDLDAAASWADVKAINGVQTGDVVAGNMVAAPNGAITASEKMEYFALAIHMKEDADNRYQGKDVTIDVTVLATQLASEFDSFDDQYDKGAYLPTVYTAEELLSAMENGDNVKLGADITTTKAVAVNGDAVLDLNGKTLTGDGFTVNSADLTVVGNGGKFVSTNVYSAFDLLGGSKLTLEEANIESASDGVYTLDAGNTIIINGGTIAASMSEKHPAVAVKEGNTVIINDGKLSGYFGVYLFGGEVTINGGELDTATNVVLATNGKVTINGGKLTNDGYDTVFAQNAADITITGGTFKTNPSAFVADGCAALQNADGTYTVYSSTSQMVLEDGATLDLKGEAFPGTIVAEGDLTIKGDTKIKTLKATNGGTISVEEGKTLTLNNFSFGAKANASAEYTITGGAVEASYGYFQYGEFDIESDFDTGYMYYSYSSDITVYGTFHSKGTGDGLDYVRGKLTIADGGKSIHDNSLWLGQPASWGAGVTGTVIVEEGGYLQANSISIYDDSYLYNSYANVGKDGVGVKYNTISGEVLTLAATGTELNSAIANGVSTVYLAEGNYVMTNTATGTTLKGLDKEGVVLNNNINFAGNAGMKGAISRKMHFENLTFENTVFTMEDGGKCTFTNVNFAAGVRKAYGTGVVFTDCTFGSNSDGYALHFESSGTSTDAIKLNGCQFDGGKVHLGKGRTYVFTDCDFAAGTDFQVWSKITLDGCTVDGVEVTAENANTFFPKLNLDNVTFN